MCRAAEERQELQAAVDELPAPGPQEGAHLQARGGDHHLLAAVAWQPVVDDRGEDAGQDGQRDQELLELTHQEAPQRRQGQHRQASSGAGRGRGGGFGQCCAATCGSARAYPGAVSCVRVPAARPRRSRRRHVICRQRQWRESPVVDYY